MQFSKRMNSLKASEIRDLLKLTERPEMISFAGGMPAPEFFPSEAIRESMNSVLSLKPETALQYACTEGYTPLREDIARRMKTKFGASVDGEQILITSGSQQGLDFTGKLFLDEGSVVLCESPTYLAALNAFRSYMPRFVEVPTDSDGIKPDCLEKLLAETEGIRLIYVIPDFQNPTGNSWSMERRKAFMDIIGRYDIPVLEDNPYGELRYEGERLPSLLSMDTKGQVIFTGTFSKILVPGFRLGWIAAQKDILRKFALLKQGADLHTAMTTQMCIHEVLQHFDLEGHIAKLQQVYHTRRDVMLDAISRYLPLSVQPSHPQGGLFLWLTLPDDMNARDLLEKSLRNNVAFVPGGSFFPNGGHENTMRLNYSYSCEELIVEGIRRLGEVIQTL
ncbi:MAG: PLP-dependent aminotransferase family protein [Thermoclostridium sp.]|nr:PLP-dependent aminotransferase family protein [Thermoclostridium sp.]